MSTKLNIEDDLKNLRHDIDTIDHKLIELLKKRSNIVRNVGTLKATAKTGNSIIRPGREADMLKRVVEDIGDAMQPVAIAYIWRLIIASAINMEEDPKISSYAPRENRECYWLSREYFGAFTPNTQRPTQIEVVDDICDDVCNIGVLPLYGGEKGQPWWSRVCDNTDKPRPYIFANLPFIKLAESGKPPLVAIGNVIPEQSEMGNFSYWVIKADENISLSDMEKLVCNELDARILERYRDNRKMREEQHILVEVEGFVSARDDKIIALTKILNEEWAGDASKHISQYFLGSAAKPIAFWDAI